MRLHTRNHTGSGCAYTLSRDGYDVTLFEARENLSGNARTFDWDVNGRIAKTCVSVTAWPAPLYKNYVALLQQIDVKTVPMPLSWFLYSKVPGSEGFLWAADPSAPEVRHTERHRHMQIHADAQTHRHAQTCAQTRHQYTPSIQTDRQRDRHTIYTPAVPRTLG